MRLLAYGGNASKERCRIGEWEIAEPILQSRYGIDTPNLRSYGCAVSDAKPYLIFRELQGTERGGYPFTLLLDPGGEVWRRWQWDGAELICAIVQSEECACLFKEPEKLEEASLQDILNGLRRSDPIKKPMLRDEQIGLWVGACTAEQPVLVRPGFFKFSSRPTCSEILSITSTFPPCFRMGCGWMVSATPTQARRYGVKLVIDEEAEIAPEISKQIVAIGGAAWRAWQSWSISRSSEMNDRLAAIPAGCWSEPPRRILDNIVAIARMRSGGVETEVLRDVHLFDLSLMLAPELLALAADELNRRGKSLSCDQTAELIEWCLSRGGKIPNNIAYLMDRSAILAELEKRSITPGAWPAGFHPPLEIRIWIFQQRLRQSVRMIPQLLQAAFRDLEPLSKGAASELVSIAVARLPFCTDSLENWGLLRARPEVFQMAVVPLRNEARRRMRKHIGDWQKDYLMFGDDAGGDCFHSDSEESFKAMVRTAKDILASTRPEDEELHAATRHWFDALAHSRHREPMSYRLKRQIACEFGGKWQALCALDHFLCGEYTSLPSIDELEARRLRVELRQYLEWRKSLPDSFPLLQLVGWLHPLEEIIVQKILKMTPRFPEGKSADVWIEGVREMAGEEIARLQSAELVAKHPELLDRLPLGEEKLATLIRSELFEEQHDRHLLTKLAQTPVRFGRILDAALNAASEPEAMCFAQQYQKDQENLSIVTDYASEAVLDKVAGWLVEYSAQEFIEHEANTIKTGLSRSAYRTGWFYAVCRLVSGQSTLLAQIANSLDMNEKSLRAKIQTLIKEHNRES